jgi:hypothetical protein
MIKKAILYVFASTGVVVFLLVIYNLLNGSETVDGVTILQIIGANIVITIGVLLLQKIECRYAIFEVLLDLGYMNAIIVLFGVFFDWFSYIPIWVTISIVVVIYILFYLLDILRIKKDIDEINKLLKRDVDEINKLLKKRKNDNDMAS